MRRIRFHLRASVLGGLILISGCSDDKATNQVVPGPDGPTNLEGWALSSSTIRLWWQDNSDDESLFVVYRRQAGPWAAALYINANQIMAVDSLLEDTTLYHYYVLARNAIGDSPTSDTISVFTMAGHRVFTMPTGSISGAKGQSH